MSFLAASAAAPDIWRIILAALRRSSTQVFAESTSTYSSSDFRRCLYSTHPATAALLHRSDSCAEAHNLLADCPRVTSLWRAIVQRLGVSHCELVSFAEKEPLMLKGGFLFAKMMTTKYTTSRRRKGWSEGKWQQNHPRPTREDYALYGFMFRVLRVIVDACYVR